MGTIVTRSSITMSRRLPFIDGVRGLAAVVVLVGHLIFITPGMREPSLHDASLVDLLLWPFRFSGEMVLLFLLVSGFALYYSERTRQMNGGRPTTYREFAARRAWRIGPIYYLALAFGLAVAPIVRDLTLRPENKVTQLVTVGGVGSHLLFVQNLNSDWLFQLNSPLWTIAYEIQLYLIFPLIYLSMRRWNPFVSAIAIVIAVKGVSLLQIGFPVFGLARWFVAGVLLAELTAQGWRIALKVSLPIGLGALLVGMAEIPRLQSESPHDVIWLTAFIFLLFAMLERPDGVRNPMASPVAHWIGLRSYSLYALHWPVMLLLLLFAQKIKLTGSGAALAVTLSGIPICFGLTMLAYRLVERPSLRRVAQVARGA